MCICGIHAPNFFLYVLKANLALANSRATCASGKLILLEGMYDPQVPNPLGSKLQQENGGLFYKDTNANKAGLNEIVFASQTVIYFC